MRFDAKLHHRRHGDERRSAGYDADEGGQKEDAEKAYEY